MDASLIAQVDALTADTTSGASELLPRAIGILREAARLPEAEALDWIRAVGLAQPTMAPLWNAALAAVADRRRPGALARFDERRRRAAGALVRSVVREALLGPPGPRHVITLSFSGSVLAALRELARRTPLTVSCTEGRPGLEGRRLALALAEEGIAVDFYGDAAIGEALARRGEGGTLVLVGADAVTSDWVLNKTGTMMLAAAAARVGVPVYVAAARDKFVDPRVARLLRIAEHGAGGVWEAAPAGVTVRNAWFEQVPTDLLSAVVSDAGTLAPDMLEDACRAASAEVTDEDIGALLGGGRDGGQRTTAGGR